MSDIRHAIPHMEEPEKSITEMLIEFYETMKGLEKDSERGGKQATKIVMTTNDLKSLFEKMYPVPTVEEISPIVPSDLRIKEKAETTYVISDDDFENEHNGEFHDYTVRKEICRKAFSYGAVWMRKMIIGR